MSFKDFDEVFNSTLKLPVRGKLYQIPSPDADTGLWCQRIFDVAMRAQRGGEVTDRDKMALHLDDEEERDLFERLLGPAWQQMFADGLPWTAVKHVGTTALIWVVTDEETAQEFWESGKGPKGRRPEDHKKPKKKSAPRVSPAGSKPKAPGPASTGETS